MCTALEDTNGVYVYIIRIFIMGYGLANTPKYMDLCCISMASRNYLSFTTKILIQRVIQSTCFDFMTLLDVFNHLLVLLSQNFHAFPTVHTTDQTIVKETLCRLHSYAL